MRRTFCLLSLSLMLCLPQTAAGVGLPAGTTITMTATAEYTDMFDRVYQAEPASVTLTIRQIAGVAVDFGTSPTATPGTMVYIPVTIANTGNGFDSVDLTAMSSHAWPVAIIYDANADGVRQSTEQLVINSTGTMVADGYCRCFVRVSVPANPAAGDDITIVATSDFDPAAATVVAETQLTPASKQSTSITAQAAPAAPFAGQPVTVSGSIAPAGVYTLDASVTAPTGSSTPRTVTTAANGSYSFSFTPLSGGTWAASVAYPGSATLSPCSVNANVPVAKATTTLALSATPATAETGAAVAVSGLLTPAMSVPVVITKRDPAGATTTSNVTTAASGGFGLNTTFDKAGEWHVIAAYAGSDRYAPVSKDILVTVTAAKQDHTMTFTAGPTASPAQVSSAGVTQCSATASDSLVHAVNYSWSDGGAGGSFSPSAGVRTPSYMAPANATGQPVTVTLTCTATCSSDSTVQAFRSTALTVNSVSITRPRVVSVSPADDEVCVDVLAPITIQFDKGMDRVSTQQALSFPPGLPLPSYSWSSDNKTLTIVHQGMLPATNYGGVVAATARDASGVEMGSEYSWAFTTRSGVGFSVDTVSTEPGFVFSTPSIVLRDIQLPYVVAFTLGIPEGIALDTTVTDGSLACLKPGSAVRSITSTWNPQTREILVSAEFADPRCDLEIIESIELTAPSGAGACQITLDGCPALIIRMGSVIPGDFNRDGAIAISDASLFISSWQRWHCTSAPCFDPLIDGVYDLAPRTVGCWPEWSPVGDQTVNISDASAFIDCWVSSRNYGATSVAQAAAKAFDLGALEDFDNSIPVMVPHAPSGSFEVAVPIPDDRDFDPAPASSGNLLNVERGSGAGTFFFTEYDAATRTVRISGCVSGAAPHRVAAIRLVP